ncbi:proline racemase [Mycena alexandri]|uniref:trans-L-3-hydroxyproline dehydratase n=1 Tax=Mycena alexandri TaxID=1745969 RepID=A0AAD6SFF9_9AGAR|nr:proline racemase [Mycena alexandri]
MDVFDTLVKQNPATRTIKIVDMHTSGEALDLFGQPTRIVVNGYPYLEGDTLLEKRRCARDKHDDIRQRLMREPRGHGEMYGAILISETELTRAGEADIGVLFCHNEGYSTMCGHATIALGRFLVDTHDLNIFPRRDALKYDEATGLTAIRLHAPCGVVHLSVYSGDGHSDATRPVSFLGVPSFVTARDLEVDIPPSVQWKRLKDAGRSRVKVDISYGGAFYALVSAAELGFPEGLRSREHATLSEFDEATRALKKILYPRKELFAHPTEPDLEYLYSVMVVEKTPQGEIGLCFFADQQIDRSPTGSCVMARVALAVAQGRLQIGDGCDYESIVSLLNDGNGFRGTAVEKRPDGVIVKVEGRAFYTGASSFVVEEHDMMPSGFTIALPD